MTTQLQFQHFNTISLAESRSASLMERADTKFIFSVRNLSQVLEAFPGTYQIIRFANSPLAPYTNIYWDTPDFHFYTQHHNGKQCRSKVRIRHYTLSGDTFLEIKQRNNRCYTHKYRQPIEQLPQPSLTPAHLLFLQSHVGELPLQPTLQNNFERITLIAKDFSERITFDINLAFSTRDVSCKFPDLVFAEVKTPRHTIESSAIHILRNLRIFPFGISKYCLGCSRLYPDIKKNLFKSKLLRIESIRHDTAA